jgi:hypothetical protein
VTDCKYLNCPTCNSKVPLPKEATPHYGHLGKPFAERWLGRGGFEESGPEKVVDHAAEEMDRTIITKIDPSMEEGRCEFRDSSGKVVCDIVNLKAIDNREFKRPYEE